MDKILNFNDAMIALANYFCLSMTPTMYNKAMTSADTEYSQALPADTKKVMIKLRSGTAALKLAYVVSESGTKYITIPIGTSKWIDTAWLASKTLYFQSPSASQVAEIEAWA